MLNYDEKLPHIIKYMGSKSKILDFIIQGISEVYVDNTPVCDLFAGSSTLAGALRNEVPIISNDIQKYSGILASTYLSSYDWENNNAILDEIIQNASQKVSGFLETFNDLNFNYSNEMTLDEFNAIEKAQQALIDRDFSAFEFHLFVKNYSGTYWSYKQCVWIDCIRAVADEYRDTPFYYIIMSSLMFAMSYNSQSTGHYAQYRDANTESSMKDILIYRQKEILPFFIRKFEELKSTLNTNNFDNTVVSMNYLDCLDIIPPNTTVYADPPYCFVHYSRFYHALETLVRYDYPEVKYKGRYRTDRHQSPFCIRTKVEKAFSDMFHKINLKEANLVLSYSNTGMISLEKLLELANSELENSYEISVRHADHVHSTMGRKDDKSREVQECLILARRRVL